MPNLLLSALRRCLNRVWHLAKDPGLYRLIPSGAEPIAGDDHRIGWYIKVYNRVSKIKITGYDPTRKPRIVALIQSGQGKAAYIARYV